MAPLRVDDNQRAVLCGEGTHTPLTNYFAGHAFSEGGRNHAPVRIGEPELNDVFLLPFEMAVKMANPGSVMNIHLRRLEETKSSPGNQLERSGKWIVNGL